MAIHLVDRRAPLLQQHSHHTGLPVPSCECEQRGRVLQQRRLDVGTRAVLQQQANDVVPSRHRASFARQISPG